MESLKGSNANRLKLLRAGELFDAMLDEVLKQGFHGTARIELTISEGTIQRIVRSVECVEK
ncbi:MAG TPA: hypothetical protein VHV08_06355 [Pirellulales bacterium]|nr:hypothetical protein [Pirellulales bacterium]